MLHAQNVCFYLLYFIAVLLVFYYDDFENDECKVHLTVVSFFGLVRTLSTIFLKYIFGLFQPCVVDTCTTSIMYLF